ncbi:uncharacterized protein LOC135392358 [Ornithodoros turicata]|uniref:uncharacterized protein LOC135392358 n=1 Tax=Ornithodoros turicata TaxID=34597 RepID=UPI003138DDFE
MARNEAGIQHKKTSPYHPQANITERVNRNLKMMLVALLVSQHHRDWDLHMAELPFATRTTVKRSTGFTPASLNLGREAPFPVENALRLRQYPASLFKVCLGPPESTGHCSSDGSGESGRRTVGPGSPVQPRTTESRLQRR